MRKPDSTRTTATAAAAVAALLVALAGCGGHASEPEAHRAGAGKPKNTPSATHGIPGVGARLSAEIPATARQAVAVYGDDAASARSTVVLYRKSGGTWHKERTWRGHNGRKGWTTDHREGDRKSPVGVFTLSDAGGVLPDPGTRLPYTASAAFTPPSYWASSTRHDFDYVVAIDYNRVKGTSPLDPTRPRGQREGGGIWIHVDHGSGTSACVSVDKAAMKDLLRTLDPALHPVVVMGDRARLGRA